MVRRLLRGRKLRAVHRVRLVYSRGQDRLLLRTCYITRSKVTSRDKVRLDGEADEMVFMNYIGNRHWFARRLKPRL